MPTAKIEPTTWTEYREKRAREARTWLLLFGGAGIFWLALVAAIWVIVKLVR